MQIVIDINVLRKRNILYNKQIYDAIVKYNKCNIHSNVYLKAHSIH